MYLWSLIIEDNGHGIDNGDEDKNFASIAIGLYCQVPLYQQSLNRDDVSNIAHGNNYEIVINGDIGDSVPGPINLYRPLPVHHEPLWRQSSGHRCPAEAILWRVQVIKYTSWALPEFLGFLLLHLKYVPLWHQLISFWNFHCNTYQICSASGVARFLCHFCTSFPCRCLFSLYLSISIYICINIYIFVSIFLYLSCRC